ncbi:esterase family protein [Curtobacterium sp. PhB78]|uniref:alpha/beta hydrolase n=1 Tax=Curtobacterium sp. PhB78 TaxID=2485102 RepID=UPI0021A4969C|nr:alpha/beta hydrolase-fold protein [Curtobacterium sp. PhB78]
MTRVGVEPGSTEQFELEESQRFPGTTRSVWVHRPAGHRADEPSAVMFFNDGWWYLDPDGDVRGGIVLDNLAAKRDLPQMIGVFVDPGVLDVNGTPTKHRNAEYDAFNDAYASFLLDEVLPIVRERFVVSDDPMMRGICGGSSGGNAAVTAAWSRPEGLGRAIAFNPSFAQMPGGNPYPAVFATEPRRQTRLFLHAAHRDLHWNEPEWNWFAESLDTAAALGRAGYDFRLVVGDGGHLPNHGGVLLPDALRWLWQAHPASVR